MTHILHDTAVAVHCPECQVWFKTTTYASFDNDVYCEDCGTHSAYRCPECQALIDTVYVEERIL